MNEKNNKKQKELFYKIVESRPYIFIGMIITVIGFILDILELCGIAKAVIITIIATILTILGVIILLIAFFLIKINYNDAKNINAELQNENTNLQNEITELKKENIILRNNATSGIKFSSNIVTISIAKNQKNEYYYHFEFEKQYTIISDYVPTYCNAQFYANKHLTNRKKAKEFYKENSVNWNELNVHAYISYRNPGKTKFSKEQELIIENITDESNYIPFKIQYIIKGKNARVDLKKNTEIKLTYCYNVPLKIWGSYINRTLSIDGEFAQVNFITETNQKIEMDVEGLYENGEPYTNSELTCESNSCHKNGKTINTVTLKSEPLKKYRVKWDIENLINSPDAENIVDGIDQLGLTNK